MKLALNLGRSRGVRRGTTGDLAVTPRQSSRRSHLEPSNCFSAPLGLLPCCGGVACVPLWTHELRRLGFFPWWVQPCRIGRRGEARQRIAPSVPNQRLGMELVTPGGENSASYFVIFVEGRFPSEVHFSMAAAFAFIHWAFGEDFSRVPWNVLRILSSFTFWWLDKTYRDCFPQIKISGNRWCIVFAR